MLNFQKHQIIQYLFIFSPNILNIFVCRIICSPLVPAVPVNLLLKRRSKKWLTYLFYRLSSIYNFWKPPPHCREWIFKHRWKCPQTTAFSTHPCKKTKPWRWQSDKNLQTQIFTFPFISAIQQFWTDPACAGWKYVSQVVMGLVVQDVVEINFDSEYITLNIEFVLRWKVYIAYSHLYKFAKPGWVLENQAWPGKYCVCGEYFWDLDPRPLHIQTEELQN